VLLRRFLFLTLAAAFLVSGLGAFEARAASVTLPVALDPGLTTTSLSTPSVIVALSNGNTTTVNGLTFSNFSYSSTAAGTATAYPATSVAVLPYISGNETGISFNAGWSASSRGILDLAISYTVSAPTGQELTDATLGITGGVTGTGTASVFETLVGTGIPPITLTASPSSEIDTVSFPGVQTLTITVDKDILLSGGTCGTATISIVNQGFSCTDPAVPEPTSMVLLGIGMAGFFTYRRLFKRASTV